MAIERRPNQQDLSWFIDLNKQNQLNLEPPYQRRSIWTAKDQKFFLDTIFNNYPCPAIYVQKEMNEEKQGWSTMYNVVDGKQRLSTVLAFYGNKISLSDNIGDERLNGKKWKNIQDEELKRRFLNYTFTVEQLSSIDSEGWNHVFDRLNRNSKTLSDQELRHARFDGWFINRAEKEAIDKLWRDIRLSSPAKARRMKDVEFISILMLVVLEKKIVGFPQSALDKLYEKYELSFSANEEKDDEDSFFEERSFDPEASEDGDNEVASSMDEAVSNYDLSEDEREEEFEREFSEAKQYLLAIENNSEILTKNKLYGAKRTTHIYTLWTYIVLTAENRPSPKDFSNQYTDFFEMFSTLKDTEESEWSGLIDEDISYNDVISYFKNSSGAATEEPQRKARLAALQNYISR